MQLTRRLPAILILVLLPLFAWSLPKVAVLDLAVQKGIDPAAVIPVTESVMEEVVGARAYVVLDRAYIEQILKEKEFQLSGMVSDTQVAQAGQYLGADYVVTGRVQMMSDTYFVVVKMIEVKTGVIVAQSSEEGEGKLSVLLSLSHKVGKKLVAAAPISALAPATAATSSAAQAPVAAPAAAAAPAADMGPVEDPVPAERVKLSIFSLRDPNDKAWKELRDAFQKKYPSITIVEETMKDAGPYYQKLGNNATTGRLPDIYRLGNENRIEPLPAKDLRPFLKGREFDFLVPGLRPRGPEGILPFLPDKVVSSSVLYAHGEILDKLGLSFPKNIDELIAQVPAIRAAGLTPIAMANKDGWQMGSCLFSTIVERMGGPGWIRRAASGRGASFKDPAFVASLAVLRRLAEAKLFSPDIDALDYNAPLASFAQSRAVYMIDGAWRLLDILRGMNDDQKNALELGAFPDIPGQIGPSGSTSAISQGYAMNPSLFGDRAAAAWLWIWFYSGPEGQRLRFQQSGDFSMDLRKLEPGLDPSMGKLMDFLARAPETEILDQVVGPAFINTSVQSVLEGKRRPEQAAQDIESWVARNEPNRRK
jgi:raffinose/stachyose/melibiose transport system substrate-binding protein